MSAVEAPVTRRVRRALFLVDSGPEAGWGHISRCLALADELSAGGWASAFALPDGEVPPGESLRLSRYPVSDLKSVLTDAQTLMRQDSASFDVVVLDHYGLDWNDEWPLRQRTRKIVVFDDLADRGHDCDILIDQTAGRQEQEYRDLVPRAAKVLAGTKYAQIRPAFRATREHSLARRRSDVRHVFVSLGGSPAQQHSAPLARAVAKALPAATAVVAMTQGAAGVEDVRAVERESRGRVRLLEGATDLAAEMANADLAIGAGGTTAWERCCLGLPTLVVVLASNQLRVTAELVAFGAAKQIDVNTGAADLERLLPSLDLERMSEKAASLCDGLGVTRVRELIDESVSMAGLRLRHATSGDSHIVWTANNDADARLASLSQESISWESHCKWYETRLGNPDHLILIILLSDQPAGVMRFQRKGETATASIALLPLFRGRGLAANAIRSGSRMARARWPIRCIDAVIRESNSASAAAFRNAGFAERGRMPGGLRLFAEIWPPFQAP